MINASVVKVASIKIIERLRARCSENPRTLKIVPTTIIYPGGIQKMAR
jgi:hypothetical protein